MHVHVNLAMSADGRIAAPGGGPLRLSSEEDFARVHRLRHGADAILVGVGTVLADDPSLLTKERFVPHPRHPVRVVLDGRLRTPATARVLDGRAPTLVYTASEHAHRALPGAEVVAAGEGRVHLPLVLGDLAARGVRTTLVEGGGRVIASFLAEGLVNLLTVYVAPTVVGSDAPGWAEGPGLFRDGQGTPLRLTAVDRVGDGVLLTYELGQTP